MATSILRPPDLSKIGARLKRWQKQHETPAKLAAAHRRVVLRRVVESMAFENEPVSTNRLKALPDHRKGQPAPSESTRYIQTSEGSLSYTQVSERLTVDRSSRLLPPRAAALAGGVHGQIGTVTHTCCCRLDRCGLDASD